MLQRSAEFHFAGWVFKNFCSEKTNKQTNKKGAVTKGFMDKQEVNTSQLYSLTLDVLGSVRQSSFLVPSGSNPHPAECHTSTYYFWSNSSV